MKTRIKKMKANGFYLIKGNSSANNLFFENKKDQQLFLNLLNRFLDGLIDLQYYSTNATGWVLCFTTKDEMQIREAYLQLKMKSKTKVKSNLQFEVGKILSEHFRFFLSAYVKQSNFRHGRKGGLVRSKMEKYIFENEADLREEIANMKAMQEFKCQPRKYRPNKRYYLVEKQLKRESVWRSSFVGLGGESQVKMVVPCFSDVLNKIDLLREFIVTTWKLHFATQIDPFPPPLIN